MDEDEDDFIFYGTPIEREEETSARKRKAVADAGQLRSLPVWKQEVRDEEGRRRFHGAFTGGFSAGYYNTVGTKEGWTPQAFTSSRKNRAEHKQQSIYQFLDDEDLKDIGGHALETSTQFDTFGFTASEFARKQAQKEQEKRPSAIPGPAPDEIVLPASDSIGIKLLQKMGWRHGHSIKDTQSDSLYYARREARKALIAFSSNLAEPDLAETESSRHDSEDLPEESNDGLFSSQSTPVYVLHPKQDLHGLGFDPFKHAPEFRGRKELHNSKTKERNSRRGLSMGKDLLASNSGKYAPGFGIGALEELDVEDEDIYASGFEFEETEVEENEPARTNEDTKKLEYRKQGVLSGFRVASDPEYKLERFHPPVVPPDFVPVHKFTSPLERANTFVEAPPPEFHPPEDNSLKMLIDGFATLVVRCGKIFEDLSKEKNRSNPLFAFLSGGNGHNYYVRKLWEEKQKHGGQQRLVEMKPNPVVPKLTAEGRGRILGERPLERSMESSSSIASTEVIHLQTNLSDTFMKPASLTTPSETVKPFKDDPAKQERFERFLKDKYQGGLRSTGTDKLSEADRARERLDFEAAAEAIEKGGWNKKANTQSVQQFLELARNEDMQFIPPVGIEDESRMMSKICPKREEFEWRPAPILCKRFDIIDPFMGKPLPPPRARSKMETFIFTADSFVKPRVAEAAKNEIAAPVSELQIPKEINIGTKEVDDQPTPASIQRPVDLYKAIFLDDSEDEDVANANNTGNAEKRTEGANRTLNRLIAGDFLESIGKELGLEVPPDTNGALHRTNTATSNETGDQGDIKLLAGNEKFVAAPQAMDTPVGNKEAMDSTLKLPEIAMKRISTGMQHKAINEDAHSLEESGHHHNDFQRSNRSKNSRSKDETRLRRHRSTSNSSDSDSSAGGRHYRSKKREQQAVRHETHSRRGRSRSRSFDSDSSSDRGNRVHSSSRAKRKPERKSRKHSKHHEHRRKRSQSGYSSSDNDRDQRNDSTRHKKHRIGERDALYSKRVNNMKHR